MTYKHNIDDNSRGFYYAASGDDAWDGKSVETPKKTIQAAIEAANVLVPPPSAGQLATVEEAQGSTFFEDIVLYDRISVEGSLTAIVTSGAVGIQLASTLSFNPRAIISTSANQTLILIDGEEQLGANISSMTLGGDSATGVSLIGLCSAVFITLSEIRASGMGATVIDYAGESLISSDFNFNTVNLNNDNQTFFKYAPTKPDDSVDINLSSLAIGSSLPTGTTGFVIDGGFLKVRAGTLVAGVVATVGVAGTFTASCNVISGDTISEGVVVYDTVGVIFGNLETTATGSILWRGTTITGNVTNAGNMSIVCTTLDGQITNTGQMYVQIGGYTGTLPDNDGSINGIINGIRYGNWIITAETILRGASFATQDPVALDTPLQIEFGAAQPPVLDLVGTFIAPDDGQYEIHYFLQYGRTGAGGVSWLLFYVELDGFQVGDTALAKLDGANDDVPMQSDFTIDLLAGQEVKAYIVRDSQGNNSGGLMTETPTTAINGVPSATITVERVKNG